MQGRRFGSTSRDDDEIVELTVDSLMALMELRGVRPDPVYAAISIEQAQFQFTNLLPVSTNFLVSMRLRRQLFFSNC